jgi:hypothetical protein
LRLDIYDSSWQFGRLTQERETVTDARQRMEVVINYACLGCLVELAAALRRALAAKNSMSEGFYDLHEARPHRECSNLCLLALNSSAITRKHFQTPTRLILFVHKSKSAKSTGETGLGPSEVDHDFAHGHLCLL